MKPPRGIRNNNPGNLRVNHANKWRGKITGSAKKDKSFEEFETLHYGYRALLILLCTYITRYNLRTLRQVLTRYAPPNENNTERYITSASTLSGIPLGQYLKANDKERICRLAYAISRVENGVYVGTMNDVYTAWEMI
ncbi:structural protein P5 [Porphyromonadaceae bacterium W3.11]|nr:structural protein P5 [Porphyromonadaceae bacterium W3.11]